MSENYRVKVYLAGFDKDRAAELKSILKIHHNSQGNEWFKSVLRRAADGERVLVYETNNDTDAMRVGQSYARGGAHVEVDGLQEAEEF
jgi:hypothetical protein